MPIFLTKWSESNENRITIVFIENQKSDLKCIREIELLERTKKTVVSYGVNYLQSRGNIL